MGRLKLEQNIFIYKELQEEYLRKGIYATNLIFSTVPTEEIPFVSRVSGVPGLYLNCDFQNKLAREDIFRIQNGDDRIRKLGKNGIPLSDITDNFKLINNEPYFFSAGQITRVQDILDIGNL